MSIKTLLRKCYTGMGFPVPTFSRKNGRNYITVYPFGIPISLRWPIFCPREIARIDRFDENLSVEDKSRYLTYMFKEYVGYTPDLRNPKTFNEKIQWLKLYYHNPLMTVCADKYKVREYVSEKIGAEYLVPLLGAYDSPNEIDFESLPNQFVLKVNWGSGQNVVCKDKSQLDCKSAKTKLVRWLKPSSNHYFHAFEWGYKNINPKIVCEKYISALERCPRVYKIMCFDGEPKIVQLVFNDKQTNETINYYDVDWQLLPFRQNFANNPVKIEKPSRLMEMFEMARKLSKPFPFVRTDFFEVEDAVLFSEMTFYSDSGLADFHPSEWDLKLGNLINLPK